MSFANNVETDGFEELISLVHKTSVTEGGIYLNKCKATGCQAFIIGNYQGNSEFHYDCNDMLCCQQETKTCELTWCDKHIDVHLKDCEYCENRFNKEERCF